MRRFQLAVLFVFLSPAAQAGDITVYSPGIVNAPLTALAQAWTAETGNKVTLAGFNVGRIRTAVTSDAPGDVVIAPTADFTTFAPKLVPGSQHMLGRVPFGLAVKAGGPHPDISTHEKFVAVIKDAGVLAFANPQVGSLTGGMVEDMLKRPEFAGVEARPVKGLIGDAIARGDAPFGGGAITEEIAVKGAEVVGPFPDDLGLHVDVSMAILKNSANATDAEAFLRYITRPEAQPVWKARGIIETPRQLKDVWNPNAEVCVKFDTQGHVVGALVDGRDGDSALNAEMLAVLRSHDWKTPSPGLPGKWIAMSVNPIGQPVPEVLPNCPKD